MKNYLFIGGTQDGKTLPFPNEQSEIRFPVLPPQKVETIVSGESTLLPPKSVEYEIESYFLERLRAEEETYFLYRHESITIADVFKKLLAGYKPEAS